MSPKLASLARILVLVPLLLPLLPLVSCGKSNSSVISGPIPVPAGSIDTVGDLVWRDDNGNGRIDAGEPGLPAVRVVLTDGSGLELDAIVSDGNGGYFLRALDLAPGAYFVSVETPDGYTPSPCSGPNKDSKCSPVLVTVHPDETLDDDTIDFGFVPPVPPCDSGSIGDLVWHDLDFDGIQDEGEPGLEAIRLVLRSLEDGEGFEQEVFTGPGGAYRFEDVLPGLYEVEVDESTLPPGFVPAQCDVGGNDAIDNDCSPALVEVGDATCSTVTLDFGYQSSGQGRIGDLVWHDLDRDGIQDGGEPGLEGIELHLLDVSGATVMTKTSGIDGFYEFLGVLAGVYTLEVDAESLPVHFVPSPCDAGGDDTLDNDCSGVTVVLQGDQNDPTVDFGFNSPYDGVIGDFVWNDMKEGHEPPDGIQDPSEPGIEGVVVEITDASGEYAGRSTTDGDGHYRVYGLAAGTYTVRYVEDSVPPSFFPTLCDVEGGDDALDSDCVPALSMLANDDSQDLTIDFGFTSTPFFGSIGDLLWYDNDCDGIQGPDEPGIPHIMMALKNLDNEVIDRKKTDELGWYEFRGLAAGSYVVEVDEVHFPPDAVPSPCDVGGDDDIDSECSPVLVTLETNEQVVTNVDFGYCFPCTSEIGDFVWLDLDANGLQDPGEPGIEGVCLILRDELGQELMRRFTDHDGFYAFRWLCAGTYILDVADESLPPNVVDSPCDVNGNANDDIDSDCRPVTFVVEFNGQGNDTIDFGFVESDQQNSQGCSQGYWKQPQHFGSWPPGYAPQTPFSDVFEDAFPGMSLLDVLSQGGGGLAALGRQVVAAMLNAETVAYELDPALVLALFDSLYPATNAQYEALKDYFESLNEQGCPLD